MATPKVDVELLDLESKGAEGSAVRQDDDADVPRTSTLRHRSSINERAQALDNESSVSSVIQDESQQALDGSASNVFTGSWLLILFWAWFIIVGLAGDAIGKAMWDGPDETYVYWSHAFYYDGLAEVFGAVIVILIVTDFSKSSLKPFAWRFRESVVHPSMERDLPYFAATAFTVMLLCGVPRTLVGAIHPSIAEDPTYQIVYKANDDDVEPLSDEDRAIWIQAVDDYVVPNWPDSADHELITFTNGHEVYIDEYMQRLLYSVMLYAGREVVLVIFVVCYNCTVIACAWDTPARWQTSHIEERAKLVFGDKFQRIFHSIEDRAASLKLNPKDLGWKPFVAIVVTCIVSTILMNLIIAETSFGIVFDTNMDILKSRGWPEYGAPSLGVAAEEGAAAWLFIVFNEWLLTPCALALLIYYPMYQNLIFQQRNWLRFTIMGRIIDCFNSRSAGVALSVPTSFSPLVSVGVASELAQWTELRYFLWTTTMRRDHSQSVWAVKGGLIITVGLSLYFLSFLWVSGQFGNQDRGIRFVTLLPAAMAVTIHMIKAMSKLSGFAALHCDVLRANQRQLWYDIMSIKSKIEADETDEREIESLSSAIDAIEATCAYLETYDQPVQIMGVDVTPSFTSVLFGYCVSAIIALGSTLLLG